MYGLIALCMNMYEYTQGMNGEPGQAGEDGIPGAQGRPGKMVQFCGK